MDTLNKKLVLMELGLIGVKAGLLSLLIASNSFAATTTEAELSLSNRLKEFNQPAIMVSVTKVAMNSRTGIKKPSKSVRRTKNRRACHQSSASVLRDRAEDYQPHIRANSRRYSVDESLIISVITAESCFSQRARSPKGAQGLMQLIPATAKRFGVSDAYQASQNIRGGTRYLKFLLKRFSGNMEHAIAAYNAGEGAVDRYGGIPPYRETKEYVRRVLAVYNRLNGTSVAPVPSRSETVRRAVLRSKQSLQSKGYFIKPDYKWKRKPGKKPVRATRVSRSYKVAASSARRPQGCRDASSSSIRRTTDLIKRTKLWRRHFTVKQSVPLSKIARVTGVPMTELLRLNHGISRLSVKAGRRVLVWQCSVR